MKRAAICILSFALLSFLASCKSDSSNAEDNNKNSKQTSDSEGEVADAGDATDTAESGADSAEDGKAEAKKPFKLASTAFEDGESVPTEYTCSGKDVSPPLSWSNAPDGTKSFALVIADPDAPNGTFYHWGLYNIPPDRQSLPKDFSLSDDSDMLEAENGFGKTDYGGPCPPPGDGEHRYQFRLYALKVIGLSFKDTPKIDKLLETLDRESIAKTTLTGLYERQ